MDTPCILLQTKQNGLFPSDRGYSDVSDPDLHALFELCQKATESIEAELVKRQIWITSKSSTVVDECIQKIRYTLSTVKTLQRLEDNNIVLVENAVKTLMSRPANRESKLYRTFLTDVLRAGHRGLVLLCSSSLGKQRIVSLNKQERLQIIHCLKANKALFDCPILEHLATLYQVPSYNELFPSTPSGGSIGVTKKRSWDEGPGYTTPMAFNSMDAACQTSENCQAMFTADYSASEFLGLDEAGARIILEETRKQRYALTITLPAPHANPPFMVIPHEICADIMRLHTS